MERAGSRLRAGTDRWTGRVLVLIFSWYLITMRKMKKTFRHTHSKVLHSLVEGKQMF